MDEYARKLAIFYNKMENRINNIVASPKEKRRSVNVEVMQRELFNRGEDLRKKIQEAELYVLKNRNEHLVFVALGDLHRLEMERMILFENPHYSNCTEVNR